MRHLTVRDLPSDLARALERERKRRGASLNETVKALLRRALGIDAEPFDNGLGKLAGGWSEDELREFESATAGLTVVDDEMWR